MVIKQVVWVSSIRQLLRNLWKEVREYMGLNAPITTSLTLSLFICQGWGMVITDCLLQVVITIGYGNHFVMWSVSGIVCFYWCLISWERLHVLVCLRCLEGHSESWWSFYRLRFWNLWPTQFLLTLSILRMSERLYDWLIEHQQPSEILYHGPGLYFPFLLKFLLTHSPRAFKPSLISFRAPWFDQSNLCAVFWSHFVKRQQDSSQIMFFWR